MNSKVKELHGLTPCAADVVTELKVQAAIRKASAQSEFDEWVARQYDQLAQWIASGRG